MGIKFQTLKPKTIIFSCDTDNTEIGNILSKLSREFSIDILWAYRPNMGCPRVAQVRNNGVRALMRYADYTKKDLLIFLDGDTVPESNLFEKYFRNSEKYELVLGWRVDYSKEDMREFCEENIINVLPPLKIPDKQIRYLKKLQLYQKNILF